MTPIGPRQHLRWQPTAALVSCAGVGLALVLAGVLVARPAAVVLALAFIVPALRGAWVRERCRGTALLDQSALEVQEGEAVGVSVELEDAPHAVTTLAWQPGRQELTAPVWGAVTSPTARVSVEPQLWGRHRLGPPSAVVEDASGLWRASLGTERVPLQVRPASQRMTGGAGVNAPVGLNGAHLSSVRGEGTEIAEVREYRPGDRIRRVVWRLGSRSDDLHVVEARTERDTDVLVVVDSLQPAQEVGDEPDSSLDVAVRATTALANHYLGFGDRVGVHDLGMRIGRLPTGSGPRQARVLVELASRVNREAVDPRGTLRPVAPQRPGTLCFVCTPLLLAEVVTEIGRLRSMGCEVVVVDTLPAGLGGPAPKGADAETVRLATAWRARVLLRGQLLDQLAHHGVPVTRWRGGDSLAGVLLAMERAGRTPRMVQR